MRFSVPLVLFAGCGLFRPELLDEKDFAEDYGRMFCKRLKECDRGGFKRDYHNMADCKATQDVLLRTTLVSYEELGCDYTRRGGAIAFESLAKMSCGDFYDQAYLDDYGTVWEGCEQDDTGPLE